MCLFGYSEDLVLFDFNVAVHLRNYDWSSNPQNNPCSNLLNCVLFILLSCSLLWANMKCIWCVCVCAHTCNETSHTYLEFGLVTAGILDHTWMRTDVPTQVADTKNDSSFLEPTHPPPAHRHHCHCQHQQCHHDNAPLPRSARQCDAEVHTRGWGFNDTCDDSVVQRQMT